MLLAIDIGNTQTAIGLYGEDDLVGQWRLTTDVDRTPDETRLWLRSLLEMEGFSTDSIEGVVLASVVPAVTTAFRQFGQRVGSGRVLVIEPGVRTGMPILIDNPREVGADRIVNAVAARERYGAPVVVVDFGTSTNFDVVGSDGAYLGGVIAPGLAISTNALISGTAALRRVEFVPPRSAIGKGTVEAIQSGAIYGHAGLVDGIVDRLVAEVGGEPMRIATGGLASTIVPHCRTVEKIDDHLTLDGLRMIYEMNQGDEMSDAEPSSAEGDEAPRGHSSVPLGDHPLTAGRLEKHLTRLAGEGYPYRFDRTATANDLHAGYQGLDSGTATGDEVSVPAASCCFARLES